LVNRVKRTSILYKPASNSKKTIQIEAWELEEWERPPEFGEGMSDDEWLDYIVATQNDYLPDMRVPCPCRCGSGLGGNVNGWTKTALQELMRKFPEGHPKKICMA
jgi:hypothetical protein